MERMRIEFHNKEADTLLTSHSTGIQKFILDRLIQIHEEIVNTDPEHRQLGEEPGELFKQLVAKLTPDDQLLLDRYECARIEQINRQDELVYTEGLMDGMRFGYWVAVVSRGVEGIGV